MKNIILLLILIFTLISCEQERTRSVKRNLTVCTCEERHKLQSFISDKVIKASNNMSDEEMEDVIQQLEQTGLRIYCHKEELWLKRIPNGSRYDYEIDSSKTKIDSCKFVMDYY